MASISTMDTDQPPSTSKKKENFNVRRPRGSRGRGSGRGKPNDRSQTWRERTNTRANDQIESERNAKFAAFAMPDPATAAKQIAELKLLSSSHEINAVQNLGLAVTRYAHPTPIATQGIGFLANQYYLKLSEQLGVQNVAERCSLHQFYRYSLVQLSYHLYRHMKEIAPRFSYATELPPTPIVGFDMIEAMRTCELNVGFIAGYIQRIGLVIAHDVPHVPMLMSTDVMSPFYVTIFTLRACLDGINRADNGAQFNYFLEHNPIPGIRNNNGRITNVNAIIPANYSAADVYRDASAVRVLMNYTASKMRDVNTYTGRLGNLTEGNPGMLLASKTAGEDVRIPPAEDDDPIPSIIGTVNTHYSHVNLTDDQRRLGIIGLYVREDTSGAFTPYGNVWLNGMTAHYIVSADYAAYLNRLIG